MTKIKMCGLRREADIEYANAVKPDYIGYVFAPKSRRYISPEKAAELTKKLDNDIIPVGVFVDETIENVIAAVRCGAVKMVQLHGSESEDYTAELQRMGIPVIRAFQVRSEADIKAAFSSCADHILLDSGAGTGNVFDWSVLRDVKRPYFLAGGLSPDNVSDAVRLLHPYAVDVSSGIETDGRKDEEKAVAFIAAVRKEE